MSGVTDLVEFGLARLAQCAALPSQFHDDYARWIAHMEADVAINAEWPGPTEPYPITIAVYEKHHKARPDQPRKYWQTRTSSVRNRLCALVPRIRYWPDDERELFGMEPDDNKLPREVGTLYEYEQQLARILNALERAKEMRPHERSVFIFSRRLEKLEARVKHLEEQQGKAIA
jgi:hypothetical protein